MTEQEKIDQLKDQIFKLQMVMKGVSGIAAAGAAWQETSAFNKQTFKRIESQLDEAVEAIETTH
jgi:hypothetical protein|tara:strand:- start:1780 stop:1971 length:192 start_codon:yes stop_codon:yes gene_type:complete